MATASPQPPSPQPGIGRRALNFWDRVSEGLELSQLWQQFQSDARASYGLYEKEVDWEAIQKKRGIRRWFSVAQSLFLAMLMKLSPARRVLLLASLIFIAINRIQYSSGEGSASLDFTGLGIVGLFLLLALELADRVTMKRDLEIAREIQRWLVPEAPPKIAGCDIAFATHPANTVAGDYYDVLPRTPRGNQPNQRWLLVVADVAGKSVPGRVADGHVSGQLADTFRCGGIPAGIGFRRKQLCVRPQSKRLAFYNRVRCRVGSRQPRTDLRERRTQSAHPAASGRNHGTIRRRRHALRHRSQRPL